MVAVTFLLLFVLSNFVGGFSNNAFSLSIESSTATFHVYNTMVPSQLYELTSSSIENCDFCNIIIQYQILFIFMVNYFCVYLAKKKTYIYFYVL